MFTFYLIVKKQTQRGDELDCNSVAVFNVPYIMDIDSALNILIDEFFSAEHNRPIDRSFEKAFSFSSYKADLVYLVEKDIDIFDDDIIYEVINNFSISKDRCILLEVTKRTDRPYKFRMGFVIGRDNPTKIPLDEAIGMASNKNKIRSFLNSRNVKIVV